MSEQERQQHDRRAEVLSNLEAAEREARDAIANNEEILTQIGESNPDVAAPLREVDSSLRRSLQSLEETKLPFHGGASFSLTQLDTINGHIEGTLKSVRACKQSLAQIRQALGMAAWMDS